MAITIVVLTFVVFLLVINIFKMFTLYIITIRKKLAVNTIKFFVKFCKSLKSNHNINIAVDISVSDHLHPVTYPGATNPPSLMLWSYTPEVSGQYVTMGAKVLKSISHTGFTKKSI